ncbi:MAG TPA: diguanylate cyclase [Capsulimonadaceae bacterium]|jgi:diguanylate cyclase (GGDEF)-like protein/PAS domain S-box-containing protein
MIGRQSALRIAVILGLATLCLPILGTLVEVEHSGPLSWASFLTTQANSPIIWILDVLPFAIGLIAYFAIQQQIAFLEIQSEVHLIGKNTNDLICLHLPDGTIKYASPSSITVLGYTSADLVDLHPFKFLHPDDIFLGQSLIDNGFLRSDKDARLTLRVKRVDGEYVWLETHIVPILDDAGLPVKLISTNRDVSDRVRADIMIRDSERLFRSAVETMHGGLVVHEGEGVSLCNRRALEILGLTENELLGRTPQDPRWRLIMGSGEPYPADEIPAAVTMRTGVPQRDKLMGIYRPDDTVTWVSVNTDPLFHTGEPLPYAVVVSFSDITELRADAERIQHYAQVLEQRTTDLEMLNQVLSALATEDSLTGLKNYRAFHEFLTAEIRRSSRDHAPFAVVLLDVDNFKGFNDTFGHLAGDDALRTVANIIRGATREIDLIARYGGEEFVVIFPGSGVESAIAGAERLRGAIEEYNWPLRPITASFGIAIFSPGAPSAEALLAYADKALYESKRTGKNKVTVSRENGDLPQLACEPTLFDL